MSVSRVIKHLIGVSLLYWFNILFFLFTRSTFVRMAFIGYDDVLGNAIVKSNTFKKNSSSISKIMSGRISKTNLYIKGLPVHFNDDLLEQLVPYPDKVKSVKAAMDEDFKCKGYGFIDFINEQFAEEAKTYIETNYSTYPVKFAKENEKDKTNLYITNIPKEWTSFDSDKLKRIFDKYGEVQSAFIMQEKSTNKTTGVGFVRFSSEHDAEKAIKFLEKNKTILSDCGLPLEAKYADKHNSESRKRRSIDGNLKVYPLTITNHRAPFFADSDIFPNSLLFNTMKQQDLMSLYPILLSSGSNLMSTFQSQFPYQFMNLNNQATNTAGQWNIPFVMNDFFSSPIPTIQSADFNNAINSLSLPANNLHLLGNFSNPNYIYNNHHITD